MANLGKVLLVLLYYAWMFTAFGSLLTKKQTEKAFSFSKTIMFGFFLFYIVFQVISIPVMFLQRPLSSLSRLWILVCGAIGVISTIRHQKVWREIAKTRIYGLLGCDLWSWIPILVMGINIVLVSVLYVSFWDATYYVGQVSFSVYTDTINVVDPLSGAYLEMFDLKHCLATYHVHDAVVCHIFGIPALVETKTVMVAVIAAMTNFLYYRLGSQLFNGHKESVACFMVLLLVVNICTYSAYTASCFLMYRTYEGKAITANISILAVIYLMLDLYQRGDKKELWQRLFLISWGSVSIASSAMFLVPVTIAAGVLPYAVWKKRPAILMKYGLVVLPCIAVIVCYLLGRIGWLEIAIRR